MQTQPQKKKKTILILSVIALLAFLLLIVTVLISIPHLKDARRTEAPTLPSQETAVPTETTQPPTEAPTEEPTEETTVPTLPPELNPLGKFDFQYDRHNYLRLSRGESYPGVDVSAFQGEIDWQQVKKSGIRFAMLRLGYRGYGQKGTLVKDEFIDANIRGAKEAGLSLGAYFFSQATSIEEVDEEIEFMLEILGDTELHMPVAFDWEYVSEDARTANMDADTLTAMALHFCQVMEEKGYHPIVYFNWHQGDRLMYLKELEEYPFWLALYTDRMNYPFKIEMWQWTNSGKVPGINGDVDINVYMP